MKLTRYHNSPLANSFADLNSLFGAPTSGVSPFFDFANRVARVASETTRSSEALYEDDESYHARFELPGVKKEDLSIDLNGRQLDLVVHRAAEAGDDAEREVKSQKSYTLPEGIDSEKVSAKLEDGVLTLNLPKAESIKPRSIAVG